MARNRPWTDDEDKVIIRHIKVDPSNIKAALRAAAEELGRTYGACQSRWYMHISKHEDKYHTCFVTISRRKYARNRKNVKEDIPVHAQNSIWTKLLRFFFY